jgi:hypothetical protein
MQENKDGKTGVLAEIRSKRIMNINLGRCQFGVTHIDSKFIAGNIFAD